MRIVADAHIPYLKEFFAEENELILKPGRAITHEDTQQADILLVRSITQVNAQLLASSKVKFVGSVTAGADHLDTAWLTQAGIDYSIAQGFNAPPVADYVLSVIAHLMKNHLLPETEFKAAVVGVGNVGRLVVERLELFPCRIFLSDPLRAAKETNFTSIPINDLTDLDLISFHVPLVRNGDYPTYHFIDQDFLQRQKPGCVLINASRGAIIDTQALLQYGKHLRWCLDVWENEPHIDPAVLTNACIATPHIAGYSRQSKIRGIDMIYRIACAKGLLTPKRSPTLTMPQQTLKFANHVERWEDILFGIFNPALLTNVMRSQLLEATHLGQVFDEMRNQFNYRDEFAYTTVEAAGLSHKARVFLERLGVSIKAS